MLSALRARWVSTCPTSTREAGSAPIRRGARGQLLVEHRQQPLVRGRRAGDVPVEAASVHRRQRYAGPPWPSPIWAGFVPTGHLGGIRSTCRDRSRPDRGTTSTTARSRSTFRSRLGGGGGGASRPPARARPVSRPRRRGRGSGPARPWLRASTSNTRTSTSPNWSTTAPGSDGRAVPRAASLAVRAATSLGAAAAEVQSSSRPQSVGGGAGGDHHQTRASSGAGTGPKHVGPRPRQHINGRGRTAHNPHSAESGTVMGSPWDRPARRGGEQGDPAEPGEAVSSPGPAGHAPRP